LQFSAAGPIVAFDRRAVASLANAIGDGADLGAGILAAISSTPFPSYRGGSIMRPRTKDLLPVILLTSLNLVLWTATPTPAAPLVDGYGECFQTAGTTQCDCEQYEFHDCDLCAILPW
jgi:hypothetical protein